MLPPPRRPRVHQTGLTLVELLIGTFIALTLTAAAVAFAVHETRLMGASQDRLVIAQTTHAALDLIAEDVAQAGSGIGYDSAGNFAGLMLGNFTVGACGYGLNTVSLTEVDQLNVAGTVYSVPTTDLGIRYANGNYAGIADYNALGGQPSGQHCQDMDFGDIWFAPNELVVLRSDSGAAAHTAVINSQATQGAPNTFSGTGCSYTECNNTPGRCIDFTFTLDSSWRTDALAGTANYARGEIHGGYREVVWYVEQSADPALGHQFGSLRRALFTTTNLPSSCVARAGSGVEVTQYIETLLVQPYTLNPQTGLWERWTAAPPINNARRIRLDLELVIRSQSPAPAPQRETELLLATPAQCIPAGSCGGNTDYGKRFVYRTSVEVKNSGRVRMSR